MEDTDTDQPPRIVTSVWPAVVLLVFAISVFVVTLGYSAASARFPGMVAGSMIVLVAFDLWSRTRLPGAGVVETFGGTSFRQREMMHNPSWTDQAICIGWIAAAFGLMAVAGILGAAPIYCAAFVRFRGRRSLALSVGVGLGVMFFLFGVFELALNYELYRGLFFTKGGVSAW